MALNELPVEVIDNICLQLRECSADSFRGQHPWIPAAKKALLNLCRTSKKLHRIALPHLYYYVDVNYDDRLVPFVRLLFDHPHLANQIHKISLNENEVLEHDQVLERHFSTQSPISLPETWVTQDGAVMANGRDDVYAIRLLDFLLTKARNLEFIDLTVNHDAYFNLQCFTRIIDMHAADTEFLRRLKEVVLRHWDTENGFDFEAIIPLLCKTEVKKLTLWSCTRIMDFEGCSFPSLLDLRVLDSGLSEDGLARIVEWCPNLRHFTYTLGGALVVDGGDLATPEQIVSALSPLSKTLRTLLLYLPYEEGDGGDGSEPIGSMTHFSRLKDLTIDIDALAGEVEEPPNSSSSASLGEIVLQHEGSLARWLKLLPRSLQNLCILRHWERHPQPKDALRVELSILADRAADFPNLETLTVDDKIGLKALFKKTRIEYIEVEPYTPIVSMY